MLLVVLLAASRIQEVLLSANQLYLKLCNFLGLTLVGPSQGLHFIGVVNSLFILEFLEEFDLELEVVVLLTHHCELGLNFIDRIVICNVYLLWGRLHVLNYRLRRGLDHLHNRLWLLHYCRLLLLL